METLCATKRLFYGVQATGRGHLSRFQVARQILQDAGHSVYGYASGHELPGYASGISVFESGPTFFVRNNRIAPISSFAYNVSRLPSYFRNIRNLTDHIRREQYDGAVVDFEPISARALHAARVPLILFDNQTLCLIPLPDITGVSKELKMLCHFVRLYYGPALRAASAILTYSLIPAEAAQDNQVIIPPCVRPEVLDMSTSEGTHILYYSSIGPVPAELVQFAMRHPEVEIRAYVATAYHGKSLPHNITLPDRNASTFLEDFASCRLYVSGAGFESIAEAVTLNKPVLTIPIAGQWEQRINAAIIEQYGIGLTAMEVQVSVLEKAYEMQKRPNHEIRQWVQSGREKLEGALLQV